MSVLSRSRRPLALLGAAALAAATLLGPGAPAQARATGYDVLGQDVSNHQGTISWSKQYSLGSRFAYIKATEGTGFIDSYFSDNYTNSYNAGFIRGAYHFARPDVSTGKTQADYFVAHGGGWSADGKTLPPMLDIEYNPYGSTCYGLSKTAMVSWVKSFSDELLAKTRKYPMIYTTLDWWTQCTGNSSAFAKTSPFNIANYSAQPTPPAGSPYCTIWQNADHGTFAGDQDKFNGSYTMLQNLAKNPDR